MAMSDTGRFIYSIPGTKSVSLSSDGGKTTQATTCPQATSYYAMVVCSALGAVVVVAGSSSAGNSAFFSTDYGASWTAPAAIAAETTFRSAGVSGDGTTIALQVFGATVYISTDSGASFSKVNSGSTGRGMAVSGDGSNIMFGFNAGTAWFSSNKGASFASFPLPQ